MGAKEIEGFVLVSIKHDDNAEAYNTVSKKRLKGTFIAGETYVANTEIIKLNQSSVNIGNTGSAGEIDFSIDDYLIRKEDIALLPSSDSGYYRYSIIKEEQFDTRQYQNLSNSDQVKAKLPEKYSFHHLYYMD